MSSSLEKLFIFAGEPSGDLHGSHLVHALRKQLPSILIEGVPGPKMRAQGVISILQMEDFEVMGFSDVICHLPKLARQFYQLRNHILSTRPKGVVLIDYPGFNLRMAAALRKKGYQGKIIQYVSPSVWAWGKHRIEMMANTLDILLTIYPFENQYFQGSSLNVEYVGNPLYEYIKTYHYDEQWKKKLNLPETNNLIALFPGSRDSEIKGNLPYLIETARLIQESYPDAIFGISCIKPGSLPPLPSHFFPIPRNYTYELMRDCTTAIAKSGTITLELALHHRPTVVFYKLTKLNRLYAKYLLKTALPHFCIVNILANKEVFPELIEKEVSSAVLFENFSLIHQDSERRSKCLRDLQDLKNNLGDSDASDSAAKSIARVLSC